MWLIEIVVFEEASLEKSQLRDVWTSFADASYHAMLFVLHQKGEDVFKLDF